ncbi:hypothetical protein S7335_798 [Synechococcus sp. PCC 7335]|uniref:hypothetical protein n=1 Tax=Synechococcus sp. (strain ATCC 29403 / PCC 7335) TaxID=91464 RepID=UPI00017EB1A9|nr:hypothetical protein [Synechococcus sp. PCC 7335]EDX83618.1 hypothetical protein S7335_798 [Synechococcus sp. PCC 7335]
MIGETHILHRELFSKKEVSRIPKSTLKCELVSKYNLAVSELNAELSCLERKICWHPGTSLEFCGVVGRSALHKIEKRTNLTFSTGMRIKSLKIKGAGALTHTGETIRPSDVPLYNHNPHLGFSEDGKFIRKHTQPAPTGAITLERAVCEFETAKALLKHDCPSIIPIQVYQYTDAFFLKENCKTAMPIGVVVSGVPSTSHLRADAVLRYHSLNKEEQATINEWIISLKQHMSPDEFEFDDNYPRLSLLSALSRLYGKTIRKFSKAGFYRYSGSLDNYSYCTDIGEVYLIDLDSAQKLSLLSPIRRGLEVMRDAASGLAYLVTFLTDPSISTHFPYKKVLTANPFKHFLVGYYSDVHKRNPLIIDTLASIIMRYYKSLSLRIASTSYRQTFSPVVHHYADNEAGEVVSNFREFVSTSFLRPWISRSETFSIIMPVCWLLYQESEELMASSSNMILSEDEIFSRIADYHSQELSEKVRSDILDAFSRMQ